MPLLSGFGDSAEGLAVAGLVAARWTGVGTMSDGTVRFLGHDIVRVEDGRLVAYWVASSAGA